MTEENKERAMAVMNNGQGMSMDEISKIPYSDIARMAKQLVNSNFAGMNQSQAEVLCLTCQAKGIHPILAAERYHIVLGRPAMKAEAIQAQFQACGGKIKFNEYTEKACDLTLTWAGSEINVRWTIEQASKIICKGKALTEKDNWQNYPRRMLMCRAISEGVRTIAPGLMLGIYTEDEVEEIVGKEVHAEVESVKDVGDGGSQSETFAPETTEVMASKEQLREIVKMAGGKGAVRNTAKELFNIDNAKNMTSEQAEEMLNVLAERNAKKAEPETPKAPVNEEIDLDDDDEVFNKEF